MDSFEFNKIAAAALVALLIYMGVTISSETLFHIENPETPAYSVAIVESESSSADVISADMGPSFAELMASADMTKGARAFRKCQVCHNADEGARNKVGPNLWNILGSDIASNVDFNYSSAIVSVEGNWEYEALDSYLASPSTAIPGNKMSFAGLRKATERADVIAFLRSKSASPVALPEVVSATEEVMEEAIEGEPSQ
ncbi:MAG: c-type cytochrome [Sphingomonadales bacterium]